MRIGNNPNIQPAIFKRLAFAVGLALVALTAMVIRTVALEPNEALGVRLAPGFKITLFSDEKLANDIYAMTLDNQGRVVVTGRGYIKTLLDKDGDGVADEAKLFARTETGGMGLCFDGPFLYFAGDGYWSRYRDLDGDGVADGPPEKLMPAAAVEHGGHAMRKGPDGWWYLIGGNDTGFNSKYATRINSPIKEPEAGCLIRLSPDYRQSEILLHGLRNPYDFDFNPQGDLFTYDSDVEADYFLPWYTPTRIYHLGYGSHHGWRLHGWVRSWKRPDYYVDTVDVMAAIGRGSPTGVVCYRHSQFPPHYRNGLFVLDWTFGRIFFCPLKPDGATYQTEPELFLEPIGTQGFAPNDVVVAPDGSLFVSIGGRKTRGAVFRIQFSGATRRTEPRPKSDLEAVLDAPQPLDAWSRARWVPLAQRIGKTNFWDVLIDEGRPPSDRVRAIEIVTEMFGGLPGSRALVAARSASPQVRARVAWSLGRAPCEDFGFILGILAEDHHPLVRRCALESLADHSSELSAQLLARNLPISLSFHDKRVRQAAGRLAALLPENTWRRMETELANANPQTRLSATLVNLWRPEQSPLGPLLTGAAMLERISDVLLRLQAVRLIILALGDWHLENPPVEVNTAYETALPLPNNPALLQRIVTACRAGFPSGTEALDFESARLLAMLQDPDPEAVTKVAAQISDKTSPASDFHYLVVLSRLQGSWGEGVATKLAQTVIDLDRKLEGQQQRNKQNWNIRLIEVVTALARVHPEFAFELLRHPGFPTANHIGLVAALPPEARTTAARAFLAAMERDPKFVWSGPLIELLSLLPKETVVPLFRSQWSSLALRDQILLELAKAPERRDADRFWAGLTSHEPQVIQACLEALGRLEPDSTPAHLAVLIRLLKNAIAVPEQHEMRARILFLIDRGSGENFIVREARGSTARSLKQQYQPVFVWFEKVHPGLARAGPDQSDPEIERLKAAVQHAQWSQGLPERGAILFQTRGCEICHAGPNALGPDLRGVTSRFSTEDLFTAILYPSKDVAPNYRTTTFTTKEGQSYTGIIAFESADGVIVQTGATTTARLATPDIASRQESDLSLMPTGLLAGCTPQDLSDLYSYLRHLGGGK